MIPGWDWTSRHGGKFFMVQGKSRYRWPAVVVVLVGSAWCGSGVQWAAADVAITPPVPRATLKISLQDGNGNERCLDEFAPSPLLVVAFLGTECPLAKLYGPRLEELRGRYAARGVAFVGINSNPNDSTTEIAAYVARHGIGFPLLRDAEGQLAGQLRATRTPEVFLLDRDRKIRYRGRIDDQYGPGYARPEPGHHELAEAIEAVLTGAAVSVPQTEPVGCLIPQIRPAVAGADVTYSGRIAAILQARCVECHRAGDIGPMALTDFDEVKAWSGMIAEVVQEGRMPPWHASPLHGTFRNDRQLTAEEKQAIAQWVEFGAPLGDAAAVPPTPEFVAGWQLPQVPDAIYTIQPEPFPIPSAGEVDYQWFEVDPGFTEDRWVRAVEIQPGNRAVVHHILAFIRPPGHSDHRGEDRGYFAGYVPGVRATPMPDGMARFVPAGSTLAFQVHYTPIGSEQTDQSRIGLVFADPATVTHRVISSSAINTKIDIPPGAADHREVAKSRRIPWDVRLLSMSPHMHFRGKSFRYDVEFPDGRREVLLDVPRYDFNWQTEYCLAEPVSLPAGTVIHGEACYDNSAANPHNPDPGRRVPWGDQTWDEMMIGYFSIAVPIGVAVAIPESELRSPAEAAAATERKSQKMFRRLDANGDGWISPAEAPLLLRTAFASADTDGNGLVSPDEFKAALATYSGVR